MAAWAERAANAMLGAYVADAAALGFHWLYDPARIAEHAGASATFHVPDNLAVAGTKFGVVHPGKTAGDLSHYGAQMRVMVRSLAATGGRFDLGDYQDRFGPGGDWVGYIDKATRGTLANLATGRREPSGADDNQVPAVSKLPPLVAAAPEAEFFEVVDAAVTATNADDEARAYARPCAAALRAAYGGASVAEALKAGLAQATPDVAEALSAAMDSTENDPVVFAGEVGRSCPTPYAIPVIWHIAARAPDYRSAVEWNIRAGGDNCGRAPVLGALFAAEHGVGGAGVPVAWLMKLCEGRALAAEIFELTSKLEAV
ncbi:ADP-ribosylglycohydrolase family protein [bacterium]|nr:ADP-ribosylglycohydrolase family protein [bacterium]